jgi:putative tryptophan/tyrosine transport system substrate-binding protein
VRTESRRRFLRGGVGLAGLGLLSGCGRLPWLAQPQVPRVGFLVGAAAALTADFREAFRQGLADHGYAEGRDIAVEWRAAEGDIDRFVVLAEELAALRVAALVVPSTGDATLAMRATGATPIVVGGASGDLVEDGLAASFARPGGNVTGMTSPPELVGKGLQVFKEAVPGISKIAILRQGGTGPSLRTFSTDSYEEFGRRLGLQSRVLDVGRPEELDDAFAAVIAERADGLYVSNAPVLSAQRARILAFADAHRLPAMYGRRANVDDGGLMCYWPKVPELFRRAASFVDRILKGASPADLPLEQAAGFDFVINLRTAQALGLAIPPPVLQQATETIQ